MYIDLLDFVLKNVLSITTEDFHVVYQNLTNSTHLTVWS